MSKKAILAIIILMTVSLIGVSLIQITWIRASLVQNEKAFDERVFSALDRVKVRLIGDIQSSPAFREAYKDKGLDFLYDLSLTPSPTELMTRDEWELEQQQDYEFRSNLHLIDADPYLESIDQERLSALDNHLKAELQVIDLVYEYGLYSNKTESFIIENGNFVVELGDTRQSSTITENLGLRNTKYNIPILDQFGSDEPGHLHVFFPNKSDSIWKGLISSMLLSFFFIGLVMFCFAYTVYVIFKQKQISEIKNDFINNMTHEFKTPIATISLASDSIGSPRILGDKEKTKRFLGIIKEENKRMLNQVEKVLQMAQIDRKEIAIKPTMINLHELILKGVSHADLKLQTRGGWIVSKLKAKRYEIEADQTHVSNIISNLLDNALKYTTKEPNIVVETMDDKDGVKFSVTDNGLGMSKESIRHIFDKFYRVHTGNRHDIKGFGLGLSYVKAISEAHGGKVMVSSELGVGSTFTVFLPYRVN